MGFKLGKFLEDLGDAVTGSGKRDVQKEQLEAQAEAAQSALDYEALLAKLKLDPERLKQEKQLIIYIGVFVTVIVIFLIYKFVK
jgi:hypothetical protein